jgi:hypothetical protein
MKKSRGTNMNRDIRCAAVFFVLAFFTAASTAVSGQRAKAGVEQFDTSGLPAQPTTFLEQQIQAEIANHRAGDTTDALMIQRMLAQRYREKGDEARARAAEEKIRQAQAVATATPNPAATAGGSGAGSAHATPPAAHSAPATPKLKAVASGWSGRYYAMANGGMDTWEFHSDGTFLHEHIYSGGGFSSRSSERGVYRIAGSAITIQTERTANAFASSGAGSALGARTGGAGREKRLSFRMLGPHGRNGIVIDGTRMKPKDW